MSEQPWRCVRCLRQTPYVTRYKRSLWCQRCKAALDAKGTLMCRDCRVELPCQTFYVGKKLTGRCLTCRRGYNRALQRRYYARHRARRIASVKAWYRANRAHAVATAQHRYRRRKWRIWKGEERA